MIDLDILLPRKNFDLEIHEKFSESITGIFGPSGSGKTSFLHAIAGLVKPKKGRISIANRVLFDSEKKIDISVEKRNIGYVFQEGRLFPHMSVEKNLLYGFKKNFSNKINFNDVVELLNLDHILESKASEISGGESQRAALGRSLLSSPDILLLDEPFSAVDMKLRSQILPFIISIQERVAIPILVVSHDLPDLLKLTDNLFLLKNGKSLGYGNYHDLLKLESASEVFAKTSLINSIKMLVVETGSETGLTKLRWKEGKREVFLKCENSKKTYHTGQEITVFIAANDIALSRKKIVDISIQNQVEGIVKDIINRETSLICIIDAGFKLLVEISAESQKQMDIRPGTKLYCLFKSVAIDLAG